MTALSPIRTSCWAKPIPTDRFDWEAIYDDYDGADDSSNRSHIGYGSTEAEAVIDLIDNYPRGVQCEREVAS